VNSPHQPNEHLFGSQEIADELLTTLHAYPNEKPRRDGRGAGFSKLKLSMLVVHKQRENDDDRKRNSNKPKQRAFSQSHDRSPLCSVVGERTHVDLFWFLTFF
jgi:hypothetical protein